MKWPLYPVVKPFGSTLMMEILKKGRNRWEKSVMLRRKRGVWWWWAKRCRGRRCVWCRAPVELGSVIMARKWENKLGYVERRGECVGAGQSVVEAQKGGAEPQKFELSQTMPPCGLVEKNLWGKRESWCYLHCVCRRNDSGHSYDFGKMMQRTRAYTWWNSLKDARMNLFVRGQRVGNEINSLLFSCGRQEKFMAHANRGVSLEMDMFWHSEEGVRRLEECWRRGNVWLIFTEKRDVAHVGPVGQWCKCWCKLRSQQYDHNISFGEMSPRHLSNRFCSKIFTLCSCKAIYYAFFFFAAFRLCCFGKWLTIVLFV
jgi:hypothetical protein